MNPVISRIRTNSGGGAWCPAQEIAEDTYEYLQIDLGGLKVITLVETQGRFGEGQVRLLAWDVGMTEGRRKDERS